MRIRRPYRDKRTDLCQPVYLDGRRFKSCRPDSTARNPTIAAIGLTDVSPITLMVAGSSLVAPIAIEGTLKRKSAMTQDAFELV
jgi:hypothetical protein